MTRARIGSWKYRVPVIFRATPLWYFDRRFSDALLPLINELMGTDGIRFCPDWFWLQFQENVRAKIVPNILFFSPPRFQLFVIGRMDVLWNFLTNDERICKGKKCDEWKWRVKKRSYIFDFIKFHLHLHYFKLKYI